MNDYYSILGVSKNASSYQITQAYLRLIDDPNISGDKRQLVIDAYNTLSDPIKRRDYDTINDNLESYDKNVKTYQSQEHFYQDAFKQAGFKPIKKWKLILIGIIMLVIALLIVAALIWGFVAFLPLITIIVIIYLIIKIFKTR